MARSEEEARALFRTCTSIHLGHAKGGTSSFSKPASWSGDCTNIFGRPIHPTLDEFLQLVSPEDREIIRNPSNRVAGNDGQFLIELRVLWPDGSIHWMTGRGRVFLNPEGTPVRIMGTMVDTTARKTLEYERNRFVSELKSAVTAREQMLAIVSHDLKNPLTAIAMNTALLERAAKQWKSYLLPRQQRESESTCSFLRMRSRSSVTGKACSGFFRT